MVEQYGASLEAWHHWSVTLGLAEHMLPVISNPGAKISPDSNMRALGKTPSKYNFRKEAAGFPKWTQHFATMREIGQWESEPDYGICMQARAVRAIDIDIVGKRLSAAVVEAIENTFPELVWPKRYREGTGKILLPFLFEGQMPKRMIPVGEHGVIEFLGDGQQWIAEGAYLKQARGAGQVQDGRYLWMGGWPQQFPVLDAAMLETIWDTLVMLFNEGGEPTIARLPREPGTGIDTSSMPGVEDPVAQYLVDRWEVRDIVDDRIYIRCPFDAEHTSDSGPTETMYSLAGTGGYELGHFKCLHAHCMSRSDADYLEAIGWSPDLSDAPDLPALVDGDPHTPDKPQPRYIVDKQGRKENRVYNHGLFLQSEECGKHIAFDEFSANIIWCPAGDKAGEERWSLFSDEHYVQIVRQMDRNGFVPQAPSAIRGAVLDEAMRNKVDLAVRWVERLPEWDGVPRVERFLPEYLKAADTPYTRSVSLYMWTAQAGRVLDPGCQVDMAPIFVSEQGQRKTSAIGAIAPTREMFTDINLTERDENTSRKMRGVLVIELDELRGLKGRAVEDVKSFITRREEKWTPKYQEFAKAFKRRFVMYGSTNEDDFLGDPTGERRWLPVRVGIGAQIDVEGIERDRDQLWAEAVARWRAEGVAWRDAERLAKNEHADFKADLKWTDKVKTWLLTDGALDDPMLAPVDMPYQWGVEDAVRGIGERGTDADIMHVGKVLKALGATKKKVWNNGRKYAIERSLIEKSDE